MHDLCKIQKTLSLFYIIVAMPVLYALFLNVQLLKNFVESMDAYDYQLERQ